MLNLEMHHRDLSKGHLNSAASWSTYFTVLDASNSAPITENLKVYMDEEENKNLVRSFEQLVEGFRQTMPLRLEIVQKMDQDVRELGVDVAQRVLGVHFRGKDMNWHPDHPTPPTQQQMIQVIRGALAANHFDSVFVATDTPHFVRKLQRQLQIRVLSFRGVGKAGDQLGAKSPIVFHVLRDSWALSKCQVLIHSDSNVSSAARLFKGIEFEKRIEIQLGNNPSNLILSAANYLWRAVAPQGINGKKLNLVISKNEGNIN